VTIHTAARTLAALLALSVSLTACKGKESEETAGTPPVSAVQPFRITTLELGNAIDGGKRVTAPAAVFAAGDTIYAVVASDGASPSVTLAARWTYEDGQVVNEATQMIAPTGPAATEFHISKPDGLPPGKYKVEVSVNGAPGGSKEFEVR
jgi:hypothetical protein